jgi:hypothetical protein
VPTVRSSPAHRRRSVSASLSRWLRSSASSVYASQNFWPLVIIAIVVAIGNLPYLLHLFNPDPLNTLSGLGTVQSSGLISGSTAADPNVGFTAQTLGHLSMVDWLHGHVPWWNPYEGLGSPLAGEMQAATFFPPTAFLLLPNGQVLSHVAVELAAGLSTYFLLRRLSLGRAAAVAGGIAFGLNGTFSWLSHAPANPVALLPMVLLGVELAADTTGRSGARAWGLIGIALALSIYAGFPETAYVDGLFVGVWVIVRAVQLRAVWRTFILTVAKGAGLAVLLAAPLLIAFVDYLPQAYLGAHSGAFGSTALPRNAFSQAFLPYVYGPINSFSPNDATGTLTTIWGSVGGYLTFSAVILALIGLYGARFRALRVMLLIWTIVSFGRTYGVQPFQHIAFFRYSDPSWEFALIALAAFGMDDVIRVRVPRWWILASSLVSLAFFGVVANGARSEVHRLVDAAHHQAWALTSLLWALAMIGITVLAALLLRGRIRALVLVAIFSLDAALMFAIPEFSAPRSASIDTAPVSFLQKHLGSYRFYSIAPIQPNYGSYFSVSSLDVNDLPVPKLWSTFVNQDLDPNAVPIVFNGTMRKDPSGSNALEEFARHFSAFEGAGVKFLLVPTGTVLPQLPPTDALRRVFADPSTQIYQLPTPSPIFSTSQGNCVVRASTFASATVTCPRPQQLVRRELYMKGWDASSNGRSVDVTPFDTVYQQVHVPAGTSTISFSFTPPYVILGFVAFLVGVGCLLAPPIWRRRRHLITRRRGVAAGTSPDRPTSH